MNLHDVNENLSPDKPLRRRERYPTQVRHQSARTRAAA
jgi:hypothetical protein